MSDANLSAIIDEIYGAILAPEAWQRLVDRIAEWLSADMALLTSPPLPGCEAVPLIAYKFDMTPVAGEPLLAYPEFTLRALARANLPDSYLFEDLMPPAEQATNPYWQRVIVPLGITTGIITVIRTADDNRRPVVLSVFRRGASAPFGVADIEKMRALLPHLRRALGALLDGEPQAVPEQAVGGHALRGAVFYLDREGGVVSMTEAAKKLSEAGDGVTISEEGRLTVNDQRMQAPFRNALTRAIGKPWSRTFRTSSELALRASDGRSLVLVVTPLAADAISALASKARCAVFALAQMPVGEAAKRRMQDVYGLTPAEAEVAAGVADGNTVEGVAAERETSAFTVRTQMKRIYLKTGVRTQAELVALVHRLR
jgi:DNA-binding CsgD family transcriptional regulator